MTEEQTITKAAQTPDEVIASQRSRQLTIMAIVLLLLAGAVAATRFAQKTEAPKGSTNLVSFKAGDVASFEIFSGGGGDRVKLTRDGDTWRLSSRFGALVDKDEAENLVKKITDAKRLARAATEEPSRFTIFDLTYEQAAHVVMTDKQGKELVHLLVGKGQNTSSDFIRYSSKGDSKDAPPGVFELVDSAGIMETLRSRMHLDAESKPEARAWVDTGAFKTLPRDVEITHVVIHDKDVHVEIDGMPDPKDASKRTWQVVKPEASFGNAAAIDGALEAIRNMRGADVAGKPSSQGAELGVVNAERWVEIRYNTKAAASKTETMRVDFGKVKEHEVPVWITSDSKGEFIWWVNDYVITRVFRPAVDFTDVAPLPPPGPAVADTARVQHILVSYTGTRVPTKKPRTKAEARKLVQEVFEKVQAPGADWKALQEEFNEDGDPHSEYPVIKDDPNWDKAFTQGALSLKVGEVGLFETQFGYHIIKRLE
jgi:parvulin-like peptidyl-prolyl isomerase